MSHSLAVKVCGLTSVEQANRAIDSGADFVGLVFAKYSPRCVTLEQARLIVDASKPSNVNCVAVFSDSERESIMTTVEVLGLEYVQLHGPNARACAGRLPQHLKKIYAIPVDDDIQFEIVVAESVLDADRDYLLFDHVSAGSGVSFDWNQFSYTGTFRYFIAGGISVDNLSEAVHSLKPYGVDASSSLETSPGIKSLKRINTFVKKAKHL